MEQREKTKITRETKEEFNDWLDESREEELKRIEANIADLYKRQTTIKLMYYILTTLAFLLVGYALLTITNLLQPVPVIFILVLIAVFLGIIILNDRVGLYEQALHQLSLEGYAIRLGKDVGTLFLNNDLFLEHLCDSSKLGNKLLLGFSLATVVVSVLLLI